VGEGVSSTAVPFIRVRADPIAARLGGSVYFDGNRGSERITELPSSAFPPDVSPGGVRPPSPLRLWAIAVVGVAAAGSTVGLAHAIEHVPDPVTLAVVVNWIVLPYIGAGLIAWWRTPQSRFGPLMVASGFVAFLSHLSWTSLALPFGVAFPHTVGLLCILLPPVLFLHVFLAFPSGRLEAPGERLVVGAAYMTAIGLDLARMVLSGDDPDNLLGFVSEPAAVDVVRQVQLVALSLLSLAGIGVLAARRRRTGRPLRRSLSLLIDAFVFGLVMIPVLFIATALGSPELETIRRLTYGVIGLAPLAFLLGLVHTRLARASVGELLVELRTDPAPADLRDGLARALRDPSLMLAYWLPDFQSYVDLDGKAIELPAVSSKRATTLIDRDGERVAALVHDPALNDEHELLDAVTAAAAIALENGRLHAELRARLEELKGSRARIVDAGQRERQRLERNLHDGAQQRLIALSLELGLLEEELDGHPGASGRLDRAKREIATSLEELRAIARGLHPAVVSGHGLEVALEQLIARGPVPVRLNVEVGARLPERIEVAAFYLVSESLTNIGKHASATSAAVDVALKKGQVVIEVVDDGIGGADTELGSGLRGLADRVEALGGRLRIWSPRGGGTRLQAEIPCAS
jgi:signal transduction histidine kinase